MYAASDPHSLHYALQNRIHPAIVGLTVYPPDVDLC